MEHVIGRAVTQPRRRFKVRYLVLAATTISLAAVMVVFYQYWTEMSAIRQRVLAGSEVMSTPYGDIEYVVRGEGSPVLLINGSGGGYDQGLLFGDMMLGDGFMKIAVSRFGYLRSPVPDDPTVERQAALYAALLDHLGVDKATVIAMSGGGPSGIQFAHDFPQRTSSLVLASAVTKVMPPGEQNATVIGIIQSIQRSDLLFWLVARAFQPQFLAMIGIPAEAQAIFSAEEREMAQQVLDVMHPMSQRYTGSAREGEQVPLDLASLGEITTPTLILHAKDDNLVVYEHALNAHEGVKQSNLVSFETGGHGMLTQMSSVRAELSEFLENASSK